MTFVENFIFFKNRPLSQNANINGLRVTNILVIKKKKVKY